ncbi:GFA family protein [Sphingomonas sp.]|uniref:GFA family protein n=1 Tax=Sphingomonas sp. TaxID=28214 RepID=UPI0025F92477|nr:GFA family protein [Sphingomonas sp.]
MRGPVTVTSTHDGFRLTKGVDQLASYRFNTGMAEHHFCRTCGIYTHHTRRSNPNQLGINVACLDGVSPFDFLDIVVYDGDRHPADNPEHRTYVAGRLTFMPVACP